MRDNEQCKMCKQFPPCDKGKWKYCDATHWMPMPQAPESGCTEFPNNCKKGGEK